MRDERRVCVRAVGTALATILRRASREVPSVQARDNWGCRLIGARHVGYVGGITVYTFLL